jgi:hypothetical protein
MPKSSWLLTGPECSAILHETASCLDRQSPDASDIVESFEATHNNTTGKPVAYTRLLTTSPHTARGGIAETNDVTDAGTVLLSYRTVKRLGDVPAAPSKADRFRFVADTVQDFPLQIMRVAGSLAIGTDRMFTIESVTDGSLAEQDALHVYFATLERGAWWGHIQDEHRPHHFSILGMIDAELVTGYVDAFPYVEDTPV